MAIRERSNNFFMDFEDNGFGGNAMEQNEALANIFYPTAPTPVPAPAPVPTPAPAFTDPLEYLFSLDVERNPERLPIAPPVETPVEPPLEFLAPSAAFQPTPIEKAPIAPPIETPVEPLIELLAPPAAPQPAPVKKPAEAPAPKTDYTEALTKQILGQGLTGKWSGEGYGSAEKNAADMAKILSGIGITDIKQFGKVDKYEPVEQIGMTLNGKPVQGSGSQLYVMDAVDTGDGTDYVRRNLSPEEAKKVKPVYGVQSGIDEYNAPTYQPVNATNVTTKDGRLVGVTGQTFGNKQTGQAVPNTYTERQTGDFFGGTYEGKGNTGYGVQFDAQGNPVFYTQGASSSDMDSIAPFLTLASFVPGLAPFAMAANAAIAAKQGNVLGAITSLAGAGGLAGISGMSDIANAAKYANVLKSGDPLAILMAGAGAGGITDIGGINLNDISKTIGGIKAIESGDPLAILRYGMSALPKDEKLTSSFGPGNEQDFKDNLIPGYFQPGGEGYIPPEEEDPTTVQQQPAGLDDFLSQLEQFKQSAVTPDDIQEIISGQNFATPEDIQNAISNIPAGLTEEDLAQSLGMTKEDLLTQLGTTEESLQQRIADLESEFGGQLTDTTAGLKSKIANLDDDFSAKLEESLGTTRDDLLAELGITEEGINQRIADLESEYGGSIDDIAKNLDITREDLLSELGVTEEEVNQRITDLESEYGSNFDDIESSLGKTREELLAELGVTEEEVNQRISNLETEYGTNFDDIESSLGKTREELLAELGVTEEEMNQRISDLESEYGSNFEDIEGSLEKTREELLAKFGLSEEEMAQRIADLESEFGGQLTSGLGKQSAETRALFQNLLNRQQSQAAALAKSQAAAAAKAKADSVARAQSEAASSKNNQLQALLAMMSSNNEVAKIKSYKDLFGEDLFGTDIDLTPAGNE